MNIRRLQGLALIISALTGMLFYILNFLPYIFNSIVILEVIYGVLFIVGLSAIQNIQPQTKKSWITRTRKWWIIGLIFMAIPPFHKIISGLTIIFAIDLESYIWVDLGFFMGIAYSGGYLLVGWLTTQTRVFPVWVGWLLIIAGILHTILWFSILYLQLLPLPIPITRILGGLSESGALAGYGWTIFNHQTAYSGQRAKAPRLH